MVDDAASTVTITPHRNRTKDRRITHDVDTR